MQSRRPWGAIAVAIAALFVALTPAAAAWQPGPELYAAKKQRNVTIRLTDGRTLRADVHTPVDRVTHRALPGPFPVIVGFTPYGKTAVDSGSIPGINGLNPALVRHGYIGVIVDIPGTGGSEGHFNLFDGAEAQAGKEVVEWAARLPQSSGKVGMIGHSYSAIDQLFTAAAVGPGSPLKAIFPMAASVDPYRDLFVDGGALNTASPVGLLVNYGFNRSVNPFQELPDNLPLAARLASANIAQLNRFEGRFAKAMATNTDVRYDGPFWRQRAPEGVLQQVVANGVAVYLTGGLYDVFQRGEPLLYSGLQNAAAGRPVTAPMEPGQPASGKYQLLTGPWNHASIGAGADLTAVQLAWFDRWLKGEATGIDQTTTPFHVIEPGGGRYDTATYPLTEAPVQRLWLRSDRALRADAPTGDEPVDRLVYTGAGLTGVGAGCSRVFDQFAAGNFTPGLKKTKCLSGTRRPVAAPGEITYSTPPLAKALQLGGPIGLTLRSTSTAPDTLFATTIEDVSPDGTSEDVTSGAQLGSLRTIDPARSWPGPAGGWLLPYHVLTPASRLPVPRRGVVTRYDIEIRPAFATIPAGHRLRLRVATADFPHLIPLRDLPQLSGGVYGVRHDATEPSYVDLSVRAG